MTNSKGIWIALNRKEMLELIDQLNNVFKENNLKHTLFFNRNGIYFNSFHWVQSFHGSKPLHRGLQTLKKLSSKPVTQ